MHGLTKRPGSEHGAIGVMLAVLLSGGVLFGLGAVVIDYGQLSVEREELQSGADAASWKVAANCAKSTSACTSGTQTLVAQNYAKANAKDKLADAVICLSGTTCPAASWNTTVACPTMPVPDPGNSVGNWVEVRASTRTSTGTLLPPSFAQAMTGSTYTGKKVGGCGRVNWGPPANAQNVFALGVSLCDWKRMTSNGNVYYGVLSTLISQLGLSNILGLPNPSTGADDALVGVGLATCTLVDPSPRGYAWLRNADATGSLPDSNCEIDLDVGDWSQSFNPLATALNSTLTQACRQQLHDYQGNTLLVPIFDQVKYTNLVPSYHIVGFAPFVVTYYTGNYGLLGSAVLSLLTNANILKGLGGALCDLLSGGTGCIYGYFTKSLVAQSNPQFGTGTNFGATIIGRTG